MQQYIYGNIQLKGYRYASSEPAAFKLPAALADYDAGGTHGGLASGCHRSYWMTTVELGSYVSSDQRLVFQASAYDPDHHGICTQGYLSDKNAPEASAWGSDLLRLLRARFHEQIVQAADRGDPEEAALETIPMETGLLPAKLSPLLLRQILGALLENRKVFLRLASVGAEAMRQSREILLAVYERLPYEQRKKHGFFTGATAGAVAKIKGRLPISFFLADRDADIDKMRTLLESTDVLIDLSRAPDGAGADTYQRWPVVCRLAEEAAEKLEDFFRFCHRFQCPKPNMTIEDHQLLWDGYHLAERKIARDQIPVWAGNLALGCWDSLREYLHHTLAGQLEPDALAEELLAYAEAYDDLFRWNMGSGKGTNTARDNILKLADGVWRWYGEEGKAALEDILAMRFVALCRAQYPCLTSQKPDRGTRMALEKIPLPEKTETWELVGRVRQKTRRQLEKEQQDVLEAYLGQFRTQKSQGLAEIQAWHVFDSQGTAHSVEELYRKLERHYLCRELLLEPGPGPNWNESIGDALTQSLPQALGDDRRAELAQKNCQLFREHQGEFSDEQKRVLEAWHCARLLGIRDRNTVSELESLLTELRGIGNYHSGDAVPPLLRNHRVQKWAGENYTDNTDLLLLLAKENSQLRENLLIELAKRPGALSAGDIRDLYMAGCTKARLACGAGEKTVDTWSAAVDVAFPGLPHLPAGESGSGARRETRLILIEGLLMLLVGLLPSVCLLVWEIHLESVWAAVAAVLAAMAACFEILALALRNKSAKRLMAWQGLALLPGFFLAALMLIIGLT